MKKSKLYGSRLIEDNKLTITPELVTLESTDDVTNLTFDRGNILDAASIKLYLAATSDDLTTKYNTLSENVTTNSNDIITINTLLTTTAESINSINANITTINNSLVDYGIALEYVDNKLILKNKNSDTLSSIDLSTMTEDTYLDTVTFSNNKLIFTWNEGSSKQPITIDLSELKDKDGNELSVGNILAKSKLLFLSKNDSDTAKGLITFMKGVRIGNYTSESGGIIDVDLITGLTYLEVDKLKVRMKAYFETLSIINELSIAGKWTISPGGSILCTRVNITAELNYKCYFTNTLDNVQIENKFAVNDLAISKDFNIKTVEYQSATNHYYWRKVLEVGEDYIVLSNTDCDTGSDAPNVGDVICQLGNTTDVDRQNALVFSSVDETSPCVNLYSGINTYSLANKEYVSYGVNKTTNKAFMNVYGDMYFGDRPTIDNLYEGASYVKFNSTDKKVTIKGELDVKSTVGGTKIDLYIKNNSLSETDVNSLINNSTVISDMLNLIDGAIETYFYTGVPTLSNLPASGWVEVATETNKEIYANHVGDLYYDKDTGKAYRFMKDGNTGIYSWVTITDVDITKALADSSEALLTANVKKRIFYGTPTPPYDKGDLWVEATYPVGTTKTDAVNNEYYSEILYCNTAKALGSLFAITDWKLSNNYTKSIGTVITDLDGYKYIKDALLNDTKTSGGLILSSLIALRDSSNNVLSGINGVLNPEATGKGIATWWGGKMIDGGFTPNITTTTVTDYATSLIRFDGSGYLANGNISWDTTGKVHADPLSFFVGPTNIGIISSLFSTIPTDATSYSQVTKIHPTKPFDTLTADTITAPTFIGELQGNAATATKLKTARTLWGQSFDGTGNITGRLKLSSDNDLNPNNESHLSYGVYSDPYLNNTVALKISGGLAVGPLLYVNGTFHASGAATLDSGLTVTGNILATGNVGIGTTTPQYKLDVNGTLHAAGAVTLSSTLTAEGLITANGGTHTTALTATALSTLAATDILGDAQLSARVMSPDYVSQTTGWGITRAGAADFRNIYADELRVQAFTADISQALAGSDYLTKSVSKLSANFVVPAVNSTVRIIVDDIEGMPATRCFANNDYIRFRAFNRTSGLTIANVWGMVTLDTSYGTNGFLNGTQAYTFTCTQTTGAGLTVFKGSEVLDYGTSGSGMISRTTLDAQGSPYEQIATWVNDPSVANNYTVHARLGNLGGIANCSGHGLYTDNGFFTGKIVIGDLTKTANFLSFDAVNGLQIKLGGTSVATTTDVNNSLTTANTNAQGYADTAQSNAENNSKNYIDANVIVPCDNWEPDISYLKNRLVTFNNQTFISTVDTSDCPIMVLADENGDYLVDENGNYITPTDENGNITYNPSWKAYSSSEALEQDVAKFKKETSVTFKILNDEINSKVSSATYDMLGRRVGTAESTITQHATDIASKVAQTDYTGNTIASLINQTATTVTIQASKIDLVGAVTFNSFNSNLQASFNDKASSTSVTAAQTDATAALTRNNTMAVKLGYTDYNALASAAALGHTLIDGGMINTVLINASAVVTNGLTANCITANMISSGSVTADKLATNVLSVGNITGLGSLATQNSLAYDGSYITNKPNSLSAINPTEGTKLGGIAAGATVGATWGTNVAKIPTNLSSLTGTEGIKNTLIKISANGTLSGAGGGQVTVSGIGACTPTEAQHYATTSQNSAQDNLATKLGYTNYSDLVTKAASTDFGTLVVGGYLNTALIQAQAISTNMLAADSVTADKVNMSEFTASNGFVDSFNANVIATKRLDVAKIVADGIAAQTIDAQSATISNLNVVNATVSGTLKGVSGTFDYLSAVGSTGTLALGTYGMTFNAYDISQQGNINGRSLRYYADNIRCRGSFGAYNLNMARVHGTYIDYYVNGNTQSYVRFNLKSNGVGGYYIPLYSPPLYYYVSTYGNAVREDAAGFPVDILIIDNDSVYHYELSGATGKKITVVNANDSLNDVYLYINGATDWKVDGGKVQTFINIREFTTPLISSSVHGAGWMLCGEYDNTWA